MPSRLISGKRASRPISIGLLRWFALEVVVGTPDGPWFSFTPFLFRLHTVIATYLRDADHVFYERLTVVAVREGVPVLELIMGS